MSEEQAKIGNRIAAVTAIGGLISAAVALATYLFKPDLFNAAPAPTTIERAESTLAAPPESGAPESHSTSMLAETPSPALASPPQSLGGDITATLLNVASTPTLFTATFRISNDSDAAIMIAGHGRTGFSSAEFSLTDDMGVTCTWRRASGNPDGTLPLVTRNVDPRHYTQVAAHASTVATVNFAKRYCTTSPQSGRTVSVSGTFTIVEGETPRLAPASFEGVTPISSN